MAVRDKADILIWKGTDDLQGVGAGDAHIGAALELRRGIDIADHGQILHPLPQGRDFLRVGHMGHGTVRARLGQQDSFVRTENFGALAHEADAGEADHRVVQPGGGLA